MPGYRRLPGFFLSKLVCAGDLPNQTTCEACKRSCDFDFVAQQDRDAQSRRPGRRPHRATFVGVALQVLVQPWTETPVFVRYKQPGLILLQSFGLSPDHVHLETQLNRTATATGIMDNDTSAPVASGSPTFLVVSFLSPNTKALQLKPRST